MVGTLQRLGTDQWGTARNEWAAGASPSTADDDQQGYAAGSVWRRSSPAELWICVSASTGAAAWTRIDRAESAAVLNNWSAFADPTANDDEGGGYAAGSAWYVPSSGALWTCVSASTGAAVWRRVDSLKGQLPAGVVGTLQRLGTDQWGTARNEWAAGASPSTADDDQQGYAPGSLWRRSSPAELWICVDASTNTAAWARVDGLSAAAFPANVYGVLRRVGTDQWTTARDEYNASGAPSQWDDETQGFGPGSHWHNTINGFVWLCVDGSTGNAVWRQIA